MSPVIKICCIATIREARLALRAGADAIGLVGRMPSGPGPIPDDTIRSIVAALPDSIDTFLLTSETTAAGIAAHHRRVNTKTIQLVDRPEKGTYSYLRKELPGVKIVQVIHVTGEESVEEACEAALSVDAILLDSGRPANAVKELGGTGRTHDWEVSRRIVKRISLPVYLAGGLTPENVRKAFELVKPHGLDVCSGVRTNGMLDPDKLLAFVTAVRGERRSDTGLNRRYS